MSIAAWLTKRVVFSVGGQDWPLIFTHRALLVSERLTGMDMLAENLGKPPAHLVRALFFGALSCAGCECSIADIGRAINRDGIEKATLTLRAAWAASMADPEDVPRNEETDAREDSVHDWYEAWATGRYDFRLSDDEWLDMTPRQLHALQKVRLIQLRREELLVGILAATFENYSFCPPKKPAHAEAFMLHPLPPKPALPIGEEIMAQVAKATKQINRRENWKKGMGLS